MTGETGTGEDGRVPDRPQITVRRTVPLDLQSADGSRTGLRLTINDMRSDPDRVLLAVTGPDVADRVTAELGDEVVLAGRRWVVERVTVGDRGSVVLVGAP